MSLRLTLVLVLGLVGCGGRPAATPVNQPTTPSPAPSDGVAQVGVEPEGNAPAQGTRPALYCDNFDEASNALTNLGESEAIRLLEQCRTIADSRYVRYYLAWAYRHGGRADDAAAEYTKGLELTTDGKQQAWLYRDRGSNWQQAADKVADLSRALALEADDIQTIRLLAWVLATANDTVVRDGKRALALAKRAVKAEDTAASRDALAAALAEQGKWKDAEIEQRRAIEMAQAVNASDDLPKLNARLNSYVAHQPWRE